ncbi:MAG: hypothetical protein K6G16_10840 [Lachnospiraceae bacterium]|nr:hypothetical protein [Lachnospiraceae bacterium]
MQTQFFKKPILRVFLLMFLSAFLCGCSRTGQAAPFVPASDGSNYLQTASRLIDADGISEAAAAAPPVRNVFSALSVPTWVTRCDGIWFLVDCYHNLILYSEDIGTPLTDWFIFSSDVTQAHTLASDGTVYLTDDTENNRVLVYEKVPGERDGAPCTFVNSQVFWNIGSRPHYTVYDERTRTFYVWSSLTGELYLFRRAEGTSDVCLTEIRRVEKLDGIYVRSFTIVNDTIYFVSGVPSEKNPDYHPAILCCDLATLHIREEYPVPDSIAGMTQLVPVPSGGWIVSVSTDAAGSQDAATLLRVDRLRDLTEGKQEEIYSRFFQGGGTPYYISRVDDDWFLTEHRLKDHAVWRFRPDGRSGISDVEALY